MYQRGILVRHYTYLLLVGLLRILEKLGDHLVGPVDAVLGPLQQHMERLGSPTTAVGITPHANLDVAAGLLDQLALLRPARSDEQTDEVVPRKLVRGDGQLPRYLGAGGTGSAGHGGQERLLGQVGRPGHGGVEGWLLGGGVLRGCAAAAVCAGSSVVSPPLALGCRRGSSGSSGSGGRSERHGQILLGRLGRGGVDVDDSRRCRRSSSGNGSSSGGGCIRGVGRGGRRGHGSRAGLRRRGGHGGGARQTGRDGLGTGDGFFGGGRHGCLVAVS